MGDRDVTDIKNSVHDIRNYAGQINADLDGKILTGINNANTKGIAKQLEAINETICAGFASVVEAIANIQPPSPPRPLLQEIKFMYILKADNAPVNFSLVLGDVTDSEGNVVPDADLDVTVESDNPESVAVEFDAEAKTGVITIGSPGQANIVANAKAGDVLLGTGAASFTITVGDPAAITGVSLAFDGISES